MIARGFVGIRIGLPALLKLPVPDSDHQDFIYRIPPEPLQLLKCCPSFSVLGHLAEIHFYLIGLNSSLKELFL